MRSTKARLAWGIFLLLAGIFLVLKNLDVFGKLGDLIWGALFAVAGVGFLVWFLLDSGRWWRAVPGFTLLSTGAVVLLRQYGVDLGDWTAPLVLFGVALAFWAMLFVRAENWWALIPAGVLTVLGVLLGFEQRLDPQAWLGLFFAGLGLVFLLLYQFRLGQRDTHWAGIPAAALILMGMTILADALPMPQWLRQWWPAALAGAGALLLAAAIALRPRPQPAVPTVEPKPDFGAIEPAPGASVTERLPKASEVPAPTAKPAAPAAPDAASPDIYAVLAQQPPESKEK